MKFSATSAQHKAPVASALLISILNAYTFIPQLTTSYTNLLLQ